MTGFKAFKCKVCWELLKESRKKCHESMGECGSYPPSSGMQSTAASTGAWWGAGAPRRGGSSTLSRAATVPVAHKSEQAFTDRGPWEPGSAPASTGEVPLCPLLCALLRSFLVENEIWLDACPARCLACAVITRQQNATTKNVLPYLAA